MSHGFPLLCHFSDYSLCIYSCPLAQFHGQFALVGLWLWMCQSSEVKDWKLFPIWIAHYYTSYVFSSCHYFPFPSITTSGFCKSLFVIYIYFGGKSKETGVDFVGYIWRDAWLILHFTFIMLWMLFWFFSRRPINYIWRHGSMMMVEIEEKAVSFQKPS